jgi:phosphate transport system protein
VARPRSFPRHLCRDYLINEKRHQIENICLTLIATQQPMARDLRFLAAIPEIITELERIGDYAKGIAQINIRLGDEPLVKPLIDIPKMAEKGLNMLRRSLEAFVQRDTLPPAPSLTRTKRLAAFITRCIGSCCRS